jgi:hypothetical protein
MLMSVAGKARSNGPAVAIIRGNLLYRMSGSDGDVCIMRSPRHAIDLPTPSHFNDSRFGYNYGMFRFLQPVYNAVSRPTSDQP